MRLLDAQTLQVVTARDDDIPPYSILSHTWLADEEEVTFQDLQALARSPGVNGHVKKKDGWAKLVDTAKLSVSRGYRYTWIDTCCIDKTSSAELSEAINSMFQWYQEAAECYAYLIDVHLKKNETVPKDKDAFLELLGASRWFERGWTLQELVAPRDVQFYSDEWALLGTKRGHSGFRSSICQITGISEHVLAGYQPHSELGVATRMQWASCRRTTRPEDKAYCLLGLFGVNMPLLYGEGEKSFIRLQEEILRGTNDQSLLAWTLPRPENDATQMSGLLAPSPAAFRHSGDFHPFPPDPFRPSAPSSMTNAGLYIQLYLIPSGEDDTIFAVLDCSPIRDSQTRRELFPCVRLIKLSGDQYARTMLWALEWRDVTMYENPSGSLAGYRYLYVRQNPTRYVPRIMLSGLDDYCEKELLTRVRLVGVHPKRRWNPALKTFQPDNRFCTNNSLLGLFRYLIQRKDRPSRAFDAMVGFSVGGHAIWDCWCFGRMWESHHVPEMHECFQKASIPQEIRRSFTDQGIMATVDKITQNNRVYISLKVREIPELDTIGPGCNAPAWVDISNDLTSESVLAPDVVDLPLTLTGKLSLETRRRAVINSNFGGAKLQGITKQHFEEARVAFSADLKWDLDTMSVDKRLLSRILQAAVVCGNVEVVRAVTEKSTNASIVLDAPMRFPHRGDAEVASWQLFFSGCRPIHWAAIGGHEDVLRALLSLGASPLSLTTNAWSALHLATLMGHVGLVGYLVDQAPGLISHTNGHGDTPTDIACRHAPADTTEGILSIYLENRYLVNDLGIHYAAASNNVPAIEYLMRSMNLSVTRVDGLDFEMERLPIWHAAAVGALEAAVTLIKHGSDVNKGDLYGKTPLHIACLEGHVEMVKLLVSHGADVNRETADTALSLTACDFAALRGNVEILRFLIEKSGRVLESRMVHVKFWTHPLHIAAANGHLECVRLLCEFGCDHEGMVSCVVLRDGETETPLVVWGGVEGKNAASIAQDRGHNSVVEYLTREKGRKTHQDSSTDGTGFVIVALDVEGPLVIGTP